MIFPLPETTALTSPEKNATDTSRRAAPSVDKFAHHLRPTSAKESQRSVSSAKSAKATRSTEMDQDAEYHHCATPNQSSKKLTAVRAVDGVKDQQEPDRSDDDSDDQVHCLPFVTCLTGAPIVAEVDSTEITTSAETIGAAIDVATDTAVEATVVVETSDAALSRSEPQMKLDSTSRNETEEVTLVSVEIDSSFDDTIAPRSDLNVAIAFGGAPAMAQTSSINAVVAQVEEVSQGQTAVSPIELAVRSDESAPPAVSSHGGTKISLPAVAAAEAALPATTKEPIQEAFSQYLFGKGHNQAGLSNAGNDPTLLPVIGAITGSEQISDESDRANADAGKPNASELNTDSTPILTPSDAAQAVASTLPHNLRRHMETHAPGATAAPATPPITDAQHARLLQRVSRAFRAAEERGGEVQIRLSPPELGSMKLELSLTSGVLTAKIEVETQRAQTILLDNLSTLRDRLAEQGIRVEKFDVGLQQRDSSGQQPQHQQQHSERSSRATSQRIRAIDPSSTTEGHIQPRALHDASRLNVIV